MSRRLFLGNFDFEHRLADQNREPSAVLKQLNAELATSWLSIAEDGDFLWTPQPIAEEFFATAVAAGLPDVIPVSSFKSVPQDTECIPWGWSHEVRQLVTKHGWAASVPHLAAVRYANSRRTSNELEQRWACGLAGACRIQSTDELHQAIAQLPSANERWVVKAEFGMSARERILGDGPLQPTDQNWVRRRLAEHGNVFFEPWVERIDELGIQFNVPTSGPPDLIGLTPMRVDHRGQYVGSDFAATSAQDISIRTIWMSAIEVAVRAACHLQEAGYFGPIGIDAMRYRDANGETKLRPLQDINARWTMGRLSLGWRRGLKTGEIGYWLRAAQHEIRIAGNADTPRIIETSPSKVGTDPCRLRSCVVYQSVQVLHPTAPGANDNPKSGPNT